MKRRIRQQLVEGSRPKPKTRKRRKPQPKPDSPLISNDPSEAPEERVDEAPTGERIRRDG